MIESGLNISTAKRRLWTLLVLCAINAVILLYVCNTTVGAWTDRVLSLPPELLDSIGVSNQSDRTFVNPLILYLLVMLSVFVALASATTSFDRFIVAITLTLAFALGYSLVTMRMTTAFPVALLIVIGGGLSVGVGKAQGVVAALLLASLFITLGDNFAFDFAKPLLDIGVARNLQDFRLIGAETTVVVLLVAAAYAAIREIVQLTDQEPKDTEPKARNELHWFGLMIALTLKHLATRTVKYAQSFWVHLIRLTKQLFAKKMLGDLLRGASIIIIILAGARLLLPTSEVLAVHLKTDIGRSEILTIPGLAPLLWLSGSVFVAFVLALGFSAIANGAYQPRTHLARQLADFLISLMASAAFIGVVAKTLTWFQIFPIVGFNGAPIVTIFVATVVTVAIVSLLWAKQSK